jgi:nitrogen fixation NifU-like protein
MSLAPTRSAETVDRHALYRALVLEHARAPRNFGRLAEATHRAEGINPLCGDKLDLALVIRPDGCIARAQFVGTGCAISLASASILTELIVGLSISEAEALSATFRHALEREDDAVQPDMAEPLHALAGVRKFPSRIKCATLAWQALSSAVNNRDTCAVTTE